LQGERASWETGTPFLVLDEKPQYGSDGGINAIHILFNGRLVRSPEDVEKEKSSYKQNAEISVDILCSATQLLDKRAIHEFFVA
jgi:hypothetical protein